MSSATNNLLRFKYPRTLHLPWSTPSTDDKVLQSLDVFKDKEIVVLEKMDGENTTIYSDGYLHARSLDSNSNFTRSWMKQLASIIHHEIPNGWRFVFENVGWLHSIAYNDLISNAYLLSIWNDLNSCISYSDVLSFATQLDLATPQEFYRGPFNQKILEELSHSLDHSIVEGYVIRNVESFSFTDFQNNVAKYVRPNHVQSGQHWLKTTVPNKLSTQHKLKPYYIYEN